MTKDNNPLSWLPKPGETKEIPGGFIWCQQWDFTQSRENHITGKVVFEFSISKAEYEAAMSKQPAIEHPLPLENKE